MSEQVVKPRIRGFISLTAHPEGCAANVRSEVAAVQAAKLQGSLGNALVLGSSSGYGLASALVACFGYGAKTLGICFEREPEGDKTATAGWYNLAEPPPLPTRQPPILATIHCHLFAHAVQAPH